MQAALVSMLLLVTVWREVAVLASMLVLARWHLVLSYGLLARRLLQLLSYALHRA